MHVCRCTICAGGDGMRKIEKRLNRFPSRSKNCFLHHRSVLAVEQAQENRSLRMRERTTASPVWKPTSAARKCEVEIAGKLVAVAIGNFLLPLSGLLPWRTNLVEYQVDLILVNIKTDFCVAEKS
jgi:hypothetical protein